MEVEFIGEDEEVVAFDVIDPNGNKHELDVARDSEGTITYHGTDNYPHERENRMDEEQRIMSQVEARARFAAHQKFDERFVDPMWDPAYVERGIQALSKYPLEAFHEKFRDFYEALEDPRPYVDDPAHDPGGEAIVKAFGISSLNEIEVVSDVVVQYETASGRAEKTAPHPEYDEYDLIGCALPRMTFEDEITFENDFHKVVLVHLKCQIRDIYRNMGEDPPAEYDVEGVGKLEYFGDQHYDDGF